MFASVLRRQARTAAVSSYDSLFSRVWQTTHAPCQRPTRFLSFSAIRRFDVPVVQKQSQHPPSQQLFIGNLPYEVTEAEVREALESYGHINSLRLVLNPDGSSRGFGYITFSSVQESTAAFNAEIKILNRLMRVDYTMARPSHASGMASMRSPTPPSSTLYVGNMPFGTNEAEIREKFEPFGPLRSVRLSLDPQGTFKGFAHVEFEREDDAVAAHDSFAEEPLYMLDRNVKIDYAASRATGRKMPSPSLYFFDFRGDGLALRHSLSAFDQDIIRTYFLRSRVTGELTSTGFIEFKSVEAATAALQKHNGRMTKFGPLNLEFAVSSRQDANPQDRYNASVAARAQASDRVQRGYGDRDF
ncbi:hypothetical protein MIND_00940900 [Mycena indigotica]|uniref:RRM domain-containing protein n=1 Tax=Mycena indigotica TaxID=2126181 RepID=A0A8H6SCM2_9AGAR|nr:uncharacterized protein MIND_00940900 [Mycena indigotica]KAF7297080.1 hypothetical protein MIND_00940900 [Mycena indigotica]